MTRKNGNVKPQQSKQKERRPQMGKYRIKQTSSGLFIVLELKDVGGGYCWNDTGRKFESKEAAQAYIDAERGAAHEK